MSDISAPVLASAFPAASEADWQSRVAAILKGADYEQTLVGRTADGIRIEPLYKRKSGTVQVLGARAAMPWQIAARVDHPQAEIASEIALAELENGVDTLVLAFAGAPSARGFGLRAKSPDELDAALAGVDLRFINLRLDLGGAALRQMDLVCALIERHKLSPDTLKIDFGLDPIGYLASFGQPENSGETRPGTGETFRKLRDLGFTGSVFRADSRPYHEAGASEAQELAALIATCLAYLREANDSGVAIDEARAAVSFLLVADCDEFLTIAKARALRRLWTRIEEVCGLAPEPIHLHAETAWRMLTKLDPHTNLLRNTIAVFSAAIAGVDGICVLPFSAAQGLPDAFARRVARNTQTVLLEEANLWRVADPVAGSGGFEALTDALCGSAWSEFQLIEREGGMRASLEAGLIQQRIATVRHVRAERIASGELSIIGTTRFPNMDMISASVLEMDRENLGKRGAGALFSTRLSEAFELETDGAVR